MSILNVYLGTYIHVGIRNVLRSRLAMLFFATPMCDTTRHEDYRQADKQR